MKFKRAAGITEIEEADFKTTSLDELQKFLRSMQGEQEQSNEGLQNMNRLDSFLTSVMQYTTVTGDFVVFSDFEYFIWVSLSTRLCLDNPSIY
jgi:archaellum component FlaC